MNIVKKMLKRSYAEYVLLSSGLLFTGSALADKWDTSTNATVDTMVNNITKTGNSAKDMALVLTQLAGIAVFSTCAYKIYKIQKHHQEGSLMACVSGMIVGVIIFFAGTFMGAAKKSLVG